MAVTRESLLTFLNKKTRAKLGTIGDDAPLFSTGTIDSFVMIELLEWLGKQTGTRANADHVSFENFDTIARILAYAEARSAERK